MKSSSFAVLEKGRKRRKSKEKEKKEKKEKKVEKEIPLFLLESPKK